MLIVTTFVTPAGWLEVAYDEHYIFRSVFIENSCDKNPESRGPLGQLITEQINSYNQNPHHRCQLPLKPLGSPDQQHVWKALLVIPVGRP